ncbi:MAG: ATP-binding protein [Deltaproteobacteria bacterium]|nr:ATP-binding protein [Deltaproteobacteria bacterium]
MKTGLKLKNDLIEIERLAGCVLAFGEENELNDDIVGEIRLVLEEIVTNIISYGYEDKARHEIAVSIVNGEEDITVSVRDDAKPFNLLEYPRPDLEIPLEDRGVGGMGIHMVREIMDEINYKREDDGNLLVMRRRKL